MSKAKERKRIYALLSVGNGNKFQPMNRDDWEKLTEDDGYVYHGTIFLKLDMKKRRDVPQNVPTTSLEK